MSVCTIYSFIAGLEVAEKFVVGWWVGWVGNTWLLCLTSTKLLLSYVELSLVTLGFDNIGLLREHSLISYLSIGLLWSFSDILPLVCQISCG